MVGRTVLGRGLTVALAGWLATAGLPAVGQTRLDYRNAHPRALIQAWKTAPSGERGALAAAMVARRAQVLPVLRDTVRSGDQTEKLLACGMIAELRDRDGVEPLLAATADPDVKVRRRAATALRILADRRAAARLRELTRTETDLGVLKTTLAALGRLGDKRDIRVIEPFLSHAAYGVVVVAAGSLAMLGDERGLDTVIQATNAADPGVQKSATYALGLFSAAAAGERLQAILRDPQGAWKGYALIALGERRLAAQAPSARAATLESLARGRSRTLAEWAVDRLTDIGDAQAVAALRTLRDKHTPVAAKAERRLLALEAMP